MKSNYSPDFSEQAKILEGIKSLEVLSRKNSLNLKAKQSIDKLYNIYLGNGEGTSHGYRPVEENTFNALKMEIKYIFGDKLNSFLDRNFDCETGKSMLTASIGGFYQENKDCIVKSYIDLLVAADNLLGVTDSNNCSCSELT